jgi:hypothetical protein
MLSWDILIHIFLTTKMYTKLQKFINSGTKLVNKLSKNVTKEVQLQIGFLETNFSKNSREKIILDFSRNFRERRSLTLNNKQTFLEKGVSMNRSLL